MWIQHLKKDWNLEPNKLFSRNGMEIRQTMTYKTTSLSDSQDWLNHLHFHLNSLDFSPFLSNPTWQQWFSWLRSVMNWTEAQVWVLTLVTASNLPWPWQKDREREVWVLWLMALPAKTTSPEVKFAGNPRKRVSWNPNNRSHDVCWVVIVYDHRLFPAEGYRCKPHSQLRRVEVIGITVVASVEGMLPDRLGKCKHKLWRIQTGRTLPTARGVKW